ncbi:patatin-like phospholipase domain-containing protein 4 isoform X4 [Sciurus carolinensis]|uniref:patatin-like phospholipase domain-containing protein 4 isoform X4 n=1 Tax=Sciurus carolinensis TaxID=30640 RepID=UPI001FB3C7AD|nr:patatin-like phospholipase domain-containing protein 4 isoform X4 [Sciurus carolinensis]
MPFQRAHLLFAWHLMRSLIIFPFGKKQPSLPLQEVSQVRDKSSKDLPFGIYTLNRANMEARMKHINLSFAACGFLGIYHLGAASAFCRHGKKLLKDVKAFAGASAGSLVASVLLTAPEKIEECNQFTYQLAEETRNQSFGAVTPGYDFMARLRSGMESILPPDAHELAHRRLHVSVTNTKSRQNYLVSRFPSREDLIQVDTKSTSVPERLMTVWGWREQQLVHCTT